MPDQDDDTTPAMTRQTQRGLRWGEDVVYLGVALLLIVGAAALLVQGAVELVTTIPDGPTEAAKALLDPLLLVFILVELLSAVRMTLQERKLIAEPFLIVGMIATIKEIIVTAISAKDFAETDPSRFDDALLEIGTLSGLLVALSIASFLTRLKEREPEE
jgi:uncharacterized membrane protein (DUF373 family)